jgi:hypothetical protein
MNENSGAERGSGRSRFRLRVCAVALAGIAAAILAAPAVAPGVTRSVEYGQPGVAQMPAVLGWWTIDGNILRVPARDISRTTRSRRTQTICADYQLYKFNGTIYEKAWGFQDNRRWCVRIDAGNKLTVPTWDYAAQPIASYSLNVVVSWRIRGGKRLGRAVYDYDRVGDYQCQTIKCFSQIGYKDVGSIFFDA